MRESRFAAIRYKRAIFSCDLLAFCLTLLSTIPGICAINDTQVLAYRAYELATARVDLRLVLSSSFQSTPLTNPSQVD